MSSSDGCFKLYVRFKPNAYIISDFYNAFPDAVLARTSANFHGPALDHLWERQYTIDYPFQCLPPDLWEKARSTVSPIVPPTFELYNHSLQPFQILSFSFLGHLFLGARIECILLSLGKTPSYLSILPPLALKYPELKMAIIEINFDPGDDLQRRTLSAFFPNASMIQSVGTIKSPTFPSLRTISLGSTTLQFATEFIAQLTLSSLEVLKIGSDVLTTAFATAQLYVALSTHLPHISIESIIVGGVNGNESAPPTPNSDMSRYVIRDHHVQLLFKFINLRVLLLEGPAGFDIDDMTAFEMASTWPQITMLSLQSNTTLHYWQDYWHKMMLHGLCAFAQGCTVVAQERIIICTAHEYNINDEGEDENLDDEASQAAAYHREWKEVEQLLPVIGAAREEERLWAQRAALNET
ncbi:hypothetical protein B0H10DRAFT_1945644 [Mycena sp. CBHHK59/15]|nr:hypothetical protein B0H10DRAFT_1945644 [Mycena sp. CBHHK59/15]